MVQLQGGSPSRTASKVCLPLSIKAEWAGKLVKQQSSLIYSVSTLADFIDPVVSVVATGISSVMDTAHLCRFEIPVLAVIPALHPQSF